MNSSNQTYSGNCSLLVWRTNFATYVQELNNITNFSLPLLEACQSDICNALWGDGNADISGIGVSASLPELSLYLWTFLYQVTDH
jgi:hypothetical protein